MARFLLRRLVGALPTIFFVSLIVFLLLRFVPGDPVDLMLGDFASAQDKAELRAALGLDLSTVAQGARFVRNLFDGTWGQSLTFHRPVLEMIFERFPSTLLLGVSSLLVAILVSLPLGLIAAARAGRWADVASSTVALVAVSVPIFVTAPLVVLYFAVDLGWLPVAGADSAEHLVLPALCLGFGLSGLLTRMIRASLLDTLSEDFVRTARAKGLSEGRVLLVHALRNGLIPVVTVLGNLLGSVLAGAVLTETLFDWPGIGRLFYSAFQSRDYPLIQGIVLWTSLSYIVVNLLVDVVYAWVDPRIRLEAA